MQPHKRGNPRRRSPKRKHERMTTTSSMEVARLTLHQSDVVTGKEEMLYNLFYEMYRGYTIYSTEQGRCSIHGRDGCLRIEGYYACFPDVEQAKNLIKHFQADGRSSQEGMNRFVSQDAYVCLNSKRQRDVQSILSHLVAV